ncbi:serralysin [Cognatiyoonia koreensis]|uniref:Serralysin n=1 Tax=Cognatiyoonia koreensis TaxID=364200 RepID=A0A1I0P6L4_9RHOB|nr:hypothetical protein [Cognatiyoonia koreensis]SEW09656.1 serralysin [Cognatiyoonia koreensis]
MMLVRVPARFQKVSNARHFAGLFDRNQQSFALSSDRQTPNTPLPQFMAKTLHGVGRSKYGADPDMPNLIDDATQVANYRRQYSNEIAQTGDAVVDDLINGLLMDYVYTDGTVLTYSFELPQTYRNDPDWSELSAEAEARHLEVFAYVTSLTGVQFEEVDPDVQTANLYFGNEVGTATAYASWSSSGVMHVYNPDRALGPPGSYADHLIIHELGHGLGLAHGHDEGALPEAYRGQSWSVMSYLEHPDADDLFFSSNHGPETFMLADVATLQYQFGANFQSNAGDTVYTVDFATGEFFIDGEGQGAPRNNKILRTLWDGNGVDEIDLSNADRGVNIDLAPGAFISLGDGMHASQGRDADGNRLYAEGNIANAFLYRGDLRSILENAQGGRFNDTLSGNQVANRLTGNNGNDTVFGLEGRDILFGGNGDDRIFGGAHDDSLYDGAGRDSLYGGDGNDYLRASVGPDLFDGGAGTDFLSYYDSSVGITVDLNVNTGIAGDAYNDKISNIEGLGGSGVAADTITGNDGNNILRSYGGDDRVRDGAGSDIVTLGSGNDILWAGAGADSYNGGSGRDMISYHASEEAVDVDLLRNTTFGGLAADDTIKGFESVSGSNGGDDKLAGTKGANKLRGNGGDDRLFGRSGDDTLEGGSGRDYLDGGVGDDILNGGSGRDTFHFDVGDGQDVIADFQNNADTIEIDNIRFARGTDVFDYAIQDGRDVRFDFDDGSVLVIEDSLIGHLRNDLDIV